MPLVRKEPQEPKALQGPRAPLVLQGLWVTRANRALRDNQETLGLLGQQDQQVNQDHRDQVVIQGLKVHLVLKEPQALQEGPDLAVPRDPKVPQGPLDKMEALDLPETLAFREILAQQVYQDLTVSQGLQDRPVSLVLMVPRVIGVCKVTLDHKALQVIPANKGNQEHLEPTVNQETLVNRAHKVPRAPRVTLDRQEIMDNLVLLVTQVEQDLKDPQGPQVCQEPRVLQVHLVMQASQAL